MLRATLQSYPAAPSRPPRRPLTWSALEAVRSCATARRGGTRDQARLSDPELHLSRGGTRRTVRGDRPPGRGSRSLGLRHGAGDGPLLPAPPARAAGQLHGGELHAAGGAGPADVDGPAGCAGHRQHVPQPDAAGQDRHRARPRVVRPGTARHRCRVVRRRAPGPRLRVRDVHRPLREARGGAADHHPDAAGRTPDARRSSLPGGGRSTSRPARPRAGHDRRLGREEDPAHGGAVRRRVEPHLRPVRDPPQARRARRPLPATGPGPQRDHGERSARSASHRHTNRPKPRSRASSASAASISPTPTTPPGR